MIDETKFRAILRDEIQKALSTITKTAPDVWLSQQEAAQHCGVSVATIRNWHKQGLGAVRAGRVTRYNKVELDRFMARSVRRDTAAWALEIMKTA